MQIWSSVISRIFLHGKFRLTGQQRKKKRITWILKQANANKILAVRLLGINSTTLYAKLKEKRKSSETP
ncbi:hypothetical protein F3D56_21995 [Bacteroides ovatus]|jgi:DNA-binding NtrC family response regulator|nr:hypothetical protein F3D56_21995 [Bacteroides ovatus]